MLALSLSHSLRVSLADQLSFLKTVFDFLTAERTLHTPEAQGFGGHGGGDSGLSSSFISACAMRDQSQLGVTPTDVLNSHLLVFAAEKSRKEGRVIVWDEFEKECRPTMQS